MLVGQLLGYDRAVEVGVGWEPPVAAILAARGIDMVAIDVHDFPVPDGISFVRDGVLTRADAAGLGPYVVAEVIYTLDVSVELHRPATRVARRADANFLFTILGYDEPSAPVSRESLSGEILYIAEYGRQDQRARRDSPGRSQE